MLRTSKITHHLSEKEISHNWYLIDAQGLTLGKLADRAARILMGKNKPSFTRHMNDGDKLIIVNARHVALTGKKVDQKKYFRHTGYVGGGKETTFRQMLEKTPSRPVEKAVKGMLPKTRLGNAYYRNLFVYSDNKHPHQAQQPKKIEV